MKPIRGMLKIVVAMSWLGLGAPLVAGAGLKMVYDVALYASYRRVRPPEEEDAGRATESTRAGR